MIILLSQAVYAFCGTYVSSSDTALISRTSQVVMVRQDYKTTLTLSNDYEGEPQDFAMVIPVPSILTEDDVSVVDDSVITRVEQYSQPRLVEYSCEDFYIHPYDGPSGGCFRGTMEYSVNAQEGTYSGTSADSVTVESSFAVGEYAFHVVSSTDGGGLYTWLNENGYVLGETAEDILGDYVESGSYFLIARINLREIPEGQNFLSPIQFSYDSDIFSLPIRLGTVNSPGEQDLIVYTITDMEAGQIGIQNYDELEVMKDCMVEFDDFNTYYADLIEETMSDENGHWIREHSWAPYHCDPCTEGDALDDEDIQKLGYEGTATEAYFNRIRMRYTPEEATEDVVFYPSGIMENTQMRFIIYKDELESRYLTCEKDAQLIGGEDSCQEIFDEMDNAEEDGGCNSSQRNPFGKHLNIYLILLFVSGIFWQRRK
jgi:hypothetical protein